jgi:SAM-dependent methyltransferase
MKARRGETSRVAPTRKQRRARVRDIARPPWLADEALALLLREHAFETVLDVGCGDGRHAREFARHGKRVTTVACEPYDGFVPDIVGDVMDAGIEGRFDVVWCSHVLEHQPNVRDFLQKMASLVAPDGLLAITVPPARPTIVGGHLTVWNAGLLLYNLVVAGIDCRDARVKTYGYNISAIVSPRPAALPPLRHDQGDLERLAAFFPMPVRQGFDGRIEEIGWARPLRAEPSATLDRAAFQRMPPMCGSDLKTLAAVAAACRGDGHVLEFGVFRGRSIAVLAAAFAPRRVHGFDTFTGLPQAWPRGPGDVYPAGHFGVERLPDVPDNVALWPDEFSASLPGWLAAHPGPVGFVHVDCDLHASTRTVLDLLDDRIVPGTVLVFDELCDWSDSGVYPAWRDGEWRALDDWLRRTGRRFRVLGRGPKFSGAIGIV